MSSTDTRDRIRTHVQDDVGIHFNELVRETAYAPGQVQYHVRRLIDADELVREEWYGRTHYYPPEYDEWERGVLALFRRETTRGVVVYLLEHEPCRPATVADDLEVARSTLEYHLEHLVDHGVVEKSYDRRNRVSLSLVEPERTAPLLSAIIPTVPDRLVDRFTRLVDEVLENASESR